MKISQWVYTEGWKCTKFNRHSTKKKIVLFFADRIVLENDKEVYNSLKELHPNSDIISISTSGQIADVNVYNNDSVATVIEFESSHYKVHAFEYSKEVNSFKIGGKVAEELDVECLKHLLIFSSGTNINGSDLTEGLNALFFNKVSVTGGLAGDGVRFEKTLVGWNDQLSSNLIVAIGLYGEDIKVGFGEESGFERFGPKRTVTKSTKNVLYQIDNKDAIDLYRKYLGKRGENLVKASLYFPLSVQSEKRGRSFVRTVLSIDEVNNKMIFAGNIPEGSQVRLMRTNINNLLLSAGEAAKKALTPALVEKDELVLIVSCVGRKIILENRVEEEIEEAKGAIKKPNSIYSGFYSYGEISSNSDFKGCDLYNQTMTITSIYEH